MNEISSQTVGGGSGLCSRGLLKRSWNSSTLQHLANLRIICFVSTKWMGSIRKLDMKICQKVSSTLQFDATNWGHCGGLGFWSKESSRTHQGWDIGGRLSPLSLLVNLLPVVHWPVTACMSGGETTLPWKCCKFILKTPRLWLWKAVENWQNCGCLDSLWTAGVFEAGKGTWAATEHQLWVLCALEALRCGVWEIFTRIFHFAILISVE